MKTVPLEFAWEPYWKVLLFATDHHYADVVGWYLSEFPAADFRPQADGQLEAYMPSCKDPESSVLLADLAVPDAFPELDAYVGSTQLNRLALLPGAHVVGAVFFHHKKSNK